MRQFVQLQENLASFTEAGISVVSVEYRFIPEATADGVVPPVKGPLHDAARALRAHGGQQAGAQVVPAEHVCLEQGR